MFTRLHKLRQSDLKLSKIKRYGALPFGGNTKSYNHPTLNTIYRGTAPFDVPQRFLSGTFPFQSNHYQLVNFTTRNATMVSVKTIVKLANNTKGLHDTVNTHTYHFPFGFDVSPTHWKWNHSVGH